MNFKQARGLSKLISFIYQSASPEATQGILKINANTVELNINGGFRRLSISFNGAIYIYNNLPDGYSIKMTDSLIVINNLLLKNLKNNNILFDFDGEFEILKAYIMTVGGKKINLEIEDMNRLELINNSKTNLEDDSLLFLEEGETFESIPMKKGIDDDTIKGLYAHKPLSDGYTGHYNYHPKEKIYMTGKYLTNQSKVIGKPVSSLKMPKNKLNLSKMLTMKLKESKVPNTQVTRKSKEVKTVASKKRKIKTTKGGKY